MDSAVFSARPRLGFRKRIVTLHRQPNPRVFGTIYTLVSMKHCGRVHFNVEGVGTAVTAQVVFL